MFVIILRFNAQLCMKDKIAVVMIIIYIIYKYIYTQTLIHIDAHTKVIILILSFDVN